GSVQAFNNKFDAANDPEVIELDFMESRVSDHSGIEAIYALEQKYKEYGKRVKLVHLSPECKTLLHKASPEFEHMIVSSIDDPRYHVVTDLMDKEV
ncbi:MAG: sodium-independent anion transporter, partial [Ekhidna sp.]